MNFTLKIHEIRYNYNEKTKKISTTMRVIVEDSKSYFNEGVYNVDSDNINFNYDSLLPEETKNKLISQIKKTLKSFKNYTKSEFNFDI